MPDLGSPGTGQTLDNRWHRGQSNNFSAMKTLRVELGRERYTVHVGDGILKRAGELLAGTGLRTPPFVIADELALRLHGRGLLQSLRRSMGTPTVCEIRGGEASKCHRTVLQLYERLLGSGADRATWILAFGGGVVGDVAGFVAATYMRGIPYVNVPTTLLAQVDSAIGGKVGVNIPQGKNLVGAFHQPRAVVADVAVLSSVPGRELTSGMYEAVKCAAIRSPALMSYLERHLSSVTAGGRAALQRVVFECARIKAGVVSADEKERGSRMVLNFGHTVGHALEAATGYSRFLHGEAVGWGMAAALGIGIRLGVTPQISAERVLRLLRRLGPRPPLDGISLDRVWEALRRDKKSRGGRTTMVLLRRTGATRIVRDIQPGVLREFLRSFLAAREPSPALQPGPESGPE